MASGGGSIFVFGGCCADAARDSSFATAYRYDTATNRWSNVAPLPEPCSAAAAAYLDGRVHIVGGSCGAGNNDHDVERHLVFIPETGRYAEAAPIPWAREHLALVVADGRLYALGGRQGNKTNETASVYVYDPGSDRWAALSPMPAKRSGMAAAFVNGRIYVFGGDNGTEAHQLPSHRDVFVYDVSSNEWTRLTDLPYGVHGTGAAVVRGKIYLPGGSQLGGHDEPLNTMLVITP